MMVMKLSKQIAQAKRKHQAQKPPATPQREQASLEAHDKHNRRVLGAILMGSHLGSLRG